MRSNLVFGSLGMLCWIVMFLAGTDVWHFAGSRDFWRLSGPPYTDLRAFAYAFYAQFVVLLGMIAVTFWTGRNGVRSGGERLHR